MLFLVKEKSITLSLLGSQKKFMRVGRETVSIFRTNVMIKNQFFTSLKINCNTRCKI